MKRVFLSLLAAFAWCGLAQAAPVSSHPYLGVTYITDTVSGHKMHIVEIDLTAPGIGFAVTPASGTLNGIPATSTQTTLNFLNQKQAQVAINGNFFTPVGTTSSITANVVGLAASAGNVFSAFEQQPIVPPVPVTPDQSYAIVQYAPALNIDASNHAAIVHRDSNQPDNKHVLEPVTLYNDISGSAQIVTDGTVTIPTYSASGPLYTNGTYSNSNSWYNTTRARTCVGLTQDNKTLVLFTVDEAGGSSGMTVGDAASYMVNNLGVYNALNLDGGGSTTMAMQDPTTHIGSIVNASSDSTNSPIQGRLVALNLAVYAQPVPEPGTLTLLFVAAGAGAILITSRRKKATRTRIGLNQNNKTLSSRAIST